MRSAFRVSNIFMAALFLFAAALQYNDADPVRWMLIYLAVTAACVLEALNRNKWQVTTALALVCVVWAAVYAARGAWSVPLLDMFDEWEMKNQQVLETREMFGLALAGTWMAVLALVAWRRSRS